MALNTNKQTIIKTPLAHNVNITKQMNQVKNKDNLWQGCMNKSFSLTKSIVKEFAMLKDEI